MIANCPSMELWHKDVPRSSFGPTAAGFVVLLLWIVGFGLWATTAPIDGAVIAHGSFVATGQNKLIQHLEGGILRRIAVKEGELVQSGQVLVRLEDTAAKTRLRRLEFRIHRLLTIQARLQAELRDREDIDFPHSLLESANRGDIAELIERQRLEHQVRRKRISGEIAVLQKEIQSLEESRQGFDAQIKAARKQIDLFGQELADKQELLAKSLVRRTDVLAVRRAEARSVGELGQLLGRVGDLNERIARAQQQTVQVRSIAAQKTTEELHAVETELEDAREQIRSARDVVERGDVQSPVRGIVVKLNYHTEGGVIAPGAVLMELLPVNDELVIEARVAPSDVTHVANDQLAQVRLTALNQRVTPFVDGKVIYVSADSVVETDARRAVSPGAPGGSFIVKVALDQMDLKSKVPNFIATPGMPAEIYIRTGERTFFEYLLQPIVNSFSRAFRES